MDEPRLLRIPQKFQTVEQVLSVAKQLDLPNVLVISELANGNLVFLDTDLSVAEANWLMDRLKTLLLNPSTHERVNAI